MADTKYHLGGFDPAAPAQNRAEQWDPDAGTYTRWDRAGVVLESRPLSAVEAARFAAVSAAIASESNGRAVEDRLRAFLAANKAFLDLPSPTAADRNVQVARLTRECNALIRYVLRYLSDVADTA